MTPRAQVITKSAIQRLARRGAVVRMNNGVYTRSRELIRAFMRTVLKDSMLLMTHARRKTLTSADVIAALRRNNETMYT